MKDSTMERREQVEFINRLMNKTLQYIPIIDGKTHRIIDEYVYWDGPPVCITGDSPHGVIDDLHRAGVI